MILLPKKISLVLWVLALSVSLPTFAAGPKFEKVLWLVFENTSYEAALAQPDFHAFAEAGVLFTDFNAETRPSQGNYIAMIAGSTLGVNSSESYDFNETHLGDLLEAKGLSWKLYAEDYPGNCFRGKQAGKYYRKHNPFISFKNVSLNPERCKKITSQREFAKDVRAQQLPVFSMYIPNIDNDGHNTDVQFAGKYLMRRFGGLLKSPALEKTLLVITFDEGDTEGSNQIFTVLFGGGVKAGVQNHQRLNHYSLLKLIEERFALGSLNREDKSAVSIEGIWQP